MAVSIAIESNRALRLVAPVIDFKNFRKVRSEKRICPVCGKEFKAKLEMDNASPNDGKYCSRDCMGKDIQKGLTKFVNNEEILKFIESKKKIITHTVNFMLTTSSKDINLSPEDMLQEARVALFYLYIRTKRKNKNPFEYKDCYIIRQIQQALCPSTLERKRMADMVEDDVLECIESRSSLFSYDVDKRIDITNIIKKIYKLSKENDKVRLALMRAILTEGHLKEHSQEFMDYCEKYYKSLHKTSIAHHIKFGTEMIFYNDRTNIQTYINIKNLKNNYRFNEHYNEMLTEDELGEEIKDLLDYYSGIATCSVCGKRFKVKNNVQLAAKNPICSKECELTKVRLRNAEYRKKHRKEPEMIERVCGICGKAFLAKKSSLQFPVVYCSDECRKERERRRDKERDRSKYYQANKEKIMQKQRERRAQKKINNK